MCSNSLWQSTHFINSLGIVVYAHAFTKCLFCGNKLDFTLFEKRCCGFLGEFHLGINLVLHTFQLERYKHFIVWHMRLS